MNVLALCAGIGGLELGIKLALPSARLVCAVESDPFAASVLAARMEEGGLDPAPVWSDLRSFYGRAWRGVVDCVAAGFPCQPASTAGKRGGIADERWLWDDVARVIAECEPGVVFLENVPGLLSVDAGRAFHHVVGDLAALGFVGCYDLFRASDVGAPHRRERVFLLAHRVGLRGAGWGVAGDVAREEGAAEAHGRQRERSVDATHHRGDALAHRNGERCDRSAQSNEQQTRELEASRRSDANRYDLAWRLEGSQEAVGNSVESGLEGWLGSKRRGGYQCAAWPPGPSDYAGWARWLDAGGPPPAVESGLRGGADGLPDWLERARSDRLRCLGNAVVPAQAALAWRVLAERLVDSDPQP